MVVVTIDDEQVPDEAISPKILVVEIVLAGIK